MWCVGLFSAVVCNGDAIDDVSSAGDMSMHMIMGVP
jgi:hypothetical protein